MNRFNKQTISLGLVILAFSFLVNTFALEVGDRAPELSILKWSRGKPVELFPEHQQGKRNVYVILFWATWSNSTERLLDFVEKEKRLFAGDSVTFLGISKEQPSRVENFLNSRPSFNFSIGVDDHAETYDKYMLATQGVPMFFVIDREGRLAWKGSPFELDGVLSRVVAGTFSIDLQNKIEQLRENIRTASQVFNYDKELKAALNTLKIDPTDEIAINIVVNRYIRKNQIKKSLEFVEKARRKAGGNKYLQRNLFLIELSIIKGMNNDQLENELRKFTKRFYTTFYNNAKFLNEISIIILQNAPYETWPLDILLKISRRATYLEEKYNQSPQILASCLQTLARVYYSIGWFSKAANLQNKAIRLINDQKEKQIAVQKKNFYLKALKIRQIVFKKQQSHA